MVYGDSSFSIVLTVIAIIGFIFRMIDNKVFIALKEEAILMARSSKNKDVNLDRVINELLKNFDDYLSKLSL